MLMGFSTINQPCLIPKSVVLSPGKTQHPRTSHPLWSHGSRMARNLWRKRNLAGQLLLPLRLCSAAWPGVFFAGEMVWPSDKVRWIRLQNWRQFGCASVADSWKCWRTPQGWWLSCSKTFCLPSAYAAWSASLMHIDHPLKLLQPLECR